MRRPSISAAALTLPLVLSVAAAMSGSAAPLTAPPLPAQPGVTAGACRPPAAAPGWSTIASQVGRRAAPLMQLAVDPAKPCLVYRASSAQDLDRSLDGGRSWQPVFRDSAAGAAPLGVPFAADGLGIPVPGTVALAERGNGDAALVSADAGTHWTLMDSGLEGQPVRDLTFAPSFVPLHDGTAYATVMPSLCATAAPLGTLVAGSTCSEPLLTAAGGVGLYVTRDGGRSWTPTPLASAVMARAGITGVDCTAPCVQRLQVQVDPRNAGHIWVLVDMQSDAAPASVLLESSDYGQSYVAVPAAAGAYISQILTTVTTTHGARLYLVEPGAQPQLLVLPADGATQTAQATPLNLPALGAAPVLAADPAAGDRMMLAAAASDGGSVQVLALTTRDGFDSRGAVELSGLVHPTLAVASPLVAGADAPSTDPRAVLQAEADGAFDVAVLESCATTRCIPRGAADTSWVRQSYWRYTPPSSTVGDIIPSPLCTLCGAGAGSVQQELVSCPIPAQYDNSNGSLAYDGHELLYTRDGESDPGPYQSVIHMLDPRTCLDAGSIVVDFRPGDLETLSQAGTPYFYPLQIDDMVYDQQRNLLWASLAPGQGQRQNGAPAGDPYDKYLFTITVNDRSVSPARAEARLAFMNGCDDLLAYDFTDDTLWTCDSGDPLGHLHAATGRGLPTCMGARLHADLDGTGIGWATWLAAPPVLWVWAEDDARLIAYDSATCTERAVLRHRVFSEPVNEDEQMACDPLTFGPGSLLGTAGPVLPGTASPAVPTSVVWVRDAAANLISAFAMPLGLCPLPTLTTYAGPAQIPLGGTADLCGTLRHVYPGGSVPLAEAVSIDYAGTGTRAGVSGHVAGLTTLATGATACTSWAPQLPPGDYRVTVKYAGSSQYLSSAASGTLHIEAPAALAPPARRPPVAAVVLLPGLQQLTPPEAPAAPGPATATANDLVASQVTQAQAQAQSQSVVQTQPGMMAQRQHQTQVAIAMQTARTSQAQTAPLLAVGVRHQAAVLWAASTLGAVVALSRRPRSAVARRRHERPRGACASRHRREAGL